MQPDADATAELADLAAKGKLTLRVAETVPLERFRDAYMRLERGGLQDSEDPWGIVARLMAATPTGSYLTISHPAIDIHHAQATAQRVYNERVSTPQTLRTREQVARFFTGLDLVEPGLVQVHQWRPDPSDFAPEGVVSAHGGVARKASA